MFCNSSFLRQSVTVCSAFLLAATVAPFTARAVVTSPSPTPALGTSIGPSSSQSPYMVPVAPGVLTKSIMTVGDSVNNKAGTNTPYRMVGIPDGLGAFANRDGTFTLLMNHELGTTAGIARAHGATGAFVSKWKIRSSDLRVLEVQDLMQSVALWNKQTNSYNAPVKGVSFGRFCSADLPAPFAFYNPLSRRGTQERLFLNGEETGVEGKALAHAMNGITYELPRLGKFSRENSLAHPFTGDRTIVIGNDDSGGGQIYVYIGNKSIYGNVVERAGLNNGTLYGVKVDGLTAENSATGIGGMSRRFSLVPINNVQNLTGAQLETASNSAGVMKFLRPEDGSWNPADFNHYTFVTTNAFNVTSRLWSLHFDNFLMPEQGGTIVANVNDMEGQQMMDNEAIDLNSRTMLQEDPGNNPYLARIRQYRFDTDEFSIIAQHDPNRFLTGGSQFLTTDEESSGIIDATDILGQGWYLLDVQAHYSIPGELAEGGQLLAMYVPIPANARSAYFPGQFTKFPNFNR